MKNIFAIWIDEIDDTATSSFFSSELEARKKIRELEKEDKELGIYTPNYYKVIDFTKYLK